MSARKRKHQTQSLTEHNKIEDINAEAKKISNKSIISAISSFISYLACGTVLLCVVGYLLSPIRPTCIDDIVEVELSGRFGLNRDLTIGKKFDISSPECIVEDDEGNLYTGLGDGRIVKIFPKNGKLGEGKIENITSGFIEGGIKTNDEASHARPLGIRLRDDILFVADAVYGLYTVDTRTKVVEILVSPADVKPPLMLPDDLDITSDGKLIYFSDASTRNPLIRLAYEGFEAQCSGRLLVFNRAPRSVKVLLTDMCFPNGVQLDPDERTLLVLESARFRMRWLDTETWQTTRMMHLPAMPDNLRITKRATYWIACSSVQNKLVIQYFARMPLLRRILAGLLSFELMNRFFDRSHNLVIEIDGEGSVVRCFHDRDGELTHALSHVLEMSDGRLALGSFNAPFMAILDEPVN